MLPSFRLSVLKTFSDNGIDPWTASDVVTYADAACGNPTGGRSDRCSISTTTTLFEESCRHEWKPPGWKGCTMGTCCPLADTVSINCHTRCREEKGAYSGVCKNRKCECDFEWIASADGGMPTGDGGMPMVDGGMPMVDGGVPPGDGGVTVTAADPAGAFAQ